MKESLRVACREIYVKSMMWCPTQYSALNDHLTTFLDSELRENPAAEPNSKQSTGVKSATNTRDSGLKSATSGASLTDVNTVALSSLVKPTSKILATVVNTAIYPVQPLLTRNYLYDSTFSRIRSQAWLLHCYVHTVLRQQCKASGQHCKPSADLCKASLVNWLKISTRELVPLPCDELYEGILLDELNFGDALPYLLIIAFDYASLGDLEMRRGYIKRLLGQIRDLAAAETADAKNNNAEVVGFKKKKRRSHAPKSQDCDISQDCEAVIISERGEGVVGASCDKAAVTTGDCDVSQDCDSWDQLVDRMEVLVDIVHNVTESQAEFMLKCEVIIVILNIYCSQCFIG